MTAFDESDESAGLIDLRPMDVGDILDGTIRIYRQKPWVFMGILALIVGLPIYAQQIASVYFWDILQTIMHNIGRVEALNAFYSQEFIYSAVAVFAVGTIMFFIAPLAQAAMVYAVSEIILDRDISIAESIRIIRPRVWKIILAYLMYVALLTIFFLPFFLFIVISPLTPDKVLFIIGFLITFFICFLFIFYFMIKFLFIPQAVVLDDVGAVSALRRSFTLTSGFWWRTFGIYILIIIMVSIILGLLSQGIKLVQTGLMAIPEMTEVVSIAIGSLVAALMSIAINPITTIATTLLYYDLRVRKEGFDMLLLAESLADDKEAELEPSEQVPIG
jgi:hypothetical protein